MKYLNRFILSLGIAALLFNPLEGQVNNTVFFMPGVPQANRVNPARQPQCGFYLGLPGAAPLRVDLASSSLAYGDVIYPHPVQDSLITFLHPMGDKEAFLDLLKPVNFVASGLGTSLFSLGFRTGIGFFSVDVTARTDGNVYYPGDLARLMIDGAEEGETYLLDGIGADLSVFDEISVGWAGSISDNLHIGARARMLFGVGNLSTTRSELSVTTSHDTWHIQSDMQMNASLPFAQLQYDADGMLEEFMLNGDLDPPKPSSIPGYVFNAGNLGAAVDLGVEYRPVEPLLLSASLTDLGFINWKEGLHDVSYQMEFDFSGLEIDLTKLSENNSFGDYLDSTLNQLGDSLANYLVFSQGGVYSNRLNTKLFVGAAYAVTPGISFGILSRTDFLNSTVAEQVTATANLSAGRMVNFTLSYSYMNNYFKNLGSGLSLNLGPLNMYMISDNLLNALFWPQEARSVNLWFGMNLIFGYRQFKQGAINDRPLIY